MVRTFSEDNFVYSVDMMFVYLKHNSHPITKIDVKDYAHTLEYPGWGNPAKGIEYSATDVINSPLKYQDDYKRILQADLSYPIIISDKGYVVDGVHRLSKAYMQKIPQIKAYVFSFGLMNKFIIAEKIDNVNVWEKIDNMEAYELIDLYYQRFCNKINLISVP